MRVADTSAWIEWLIDTPVGKKVDPQLPEESHWIVPTIIQLELTKWFTREIGEEKADQIIAFTEKCVVVPLTTRIALLAADLSRMHQLATADAIVYATAREQGADLLTCDSHFKDLPQVVLISKKEV